MRIVHQEKAEVDTMEVLKDGEEVLAFIKRRLCISIIVEIKVMIPLKRRCMSKRAKNIVDPGRVKIALLEKCVEKLMMHKGMIIRGVTISA
jgi:hypothetical protein